MKKIAYIELDTHAEIAKNFYELFKDSEIFDVDFYLSERVYKLFDVKSNSVKLSEPSIILNQLSKQNYDLVIIGTAHRYFNTFLAFRAKYNSAIICHNLNFTKASKSQLLKSVFIKDFRYRLKLLLKESLLSAPSLYRKGQSLLVLDKTFSTERFEYVGLFFNQFLNDENRDEVLRIVVPGAASQSRRDYFHILESLKNLKNPTCKVEVVFLGKASFEIQQAIDNLKPILDSKVEIISFQEKVSQTDFDVWMQKADVLWCPVQKETEFLSIPEFYGISKMTGNIGDAIKYEKQAVFPSNYQTDLDFIFNEKEDVWSQFEQLKRHKKNLFSNFSKEKVRAEAEQVLLKMIK
ncbi:hypothetical protein [Soonwooa sp.]|uniref:hypothetical protein n=1 Tax=Soonwooa sp. TaxID=1938592 RepID=UPI0028A8321B|nr:hypothetical protein [Soonwooa sp.]